MNKITKHTVYRFSLLVCLTTSIFSCKKDEKDFDATGSFEAIERIISAEATGQILRLDITEGQVLGADTTIGAIDVSPLELQSEQVEASIGAIRQKTGDAGPQVGILKAQLQTQNEQVAALKQQLDNINKEVARFTKLVAADAATQKQLDDLTGQQLLLQKQLEAVRSQSAVIKEQIAAANQNVAIQNRAVLSEVEPNKKRLAILQKQIDDGFIINEYPGTVLTQYAFAGEFTSMGKPLYKIADLSVMELRAYITGDQLPQVKIAQEVTVRTDDGNGGMRDSRGVITWISNKAEFTPKTIQTKDERANQVYAIKIRVPNPDGIYKIGMYGEVVFQ